MANNNEILNELFWKKKKSYADQLKDTQVQYKPVAKTNDAKSLVLGNPTDGILVSDTNEVKKRIVGALGMAMGNNTVKSMASKAIKSFPIIISDDVSPETAVMVKTMMEEQYASYIDLLVSNQIINLTDYEVGSDEGNIAIQALNRIDGTDFGKNRLARKAQTGNLSMDDVFKNTPAWQLLRTNEDLEYKTGNPITDLLMEDAIIIPSEYENQLLEQLYVGYGIQPTKDADLASLGKNEYKEGDVFTDKKSGLVFMRGSTDEWRRINKKEEESPEQRLDFALSDLVKRNDQGLYQDYNFGITKNDKGEFRKTYEKLITPATFVNGDDLEKSLNRSVAEILSGKNAKNKREKEIADFVRDRFEKASYLLASYRISGAEYLSYLVDRLGIAISEKTRVSVLTAYPSVKVVFKGSKMWDNKGNVKFTSPYAKQMQKSIDKSEKFVLNNVVPSIVKIKGKDIVAVAAGATGAAGVGAAAGIGTAIGTGAAPLTIAGLTSIAAMPWFWPVIAGAAAVGGVGTAIARFIKKKHENKILATSIEGWERVESLINEMDDSKAELIKKMDSMHLEKTDAEQMKEFAREDATRFKSFSMGMQNALKSVRASSLAEEEITNLKGYSLNLTENKVNRYINDIKLLDEEITNDAETFAEIQELNEAAKYFINTKKPGDVIIKQQKVNAKDIAGIVPSYGTKDVVAYGSVEYDKRDIKDRKFNEPLILTIKFKERYSDGNYADNELTAVIGILGVITRVPSSEMATILRANAEGKTLNNFFKGDESNNAKDLIGNVISNFMGTRHSEKLPTSGKVWANLEKISALAMANKLSGNNNGNISNAHLVFSQKEIDQVKSETGIDYLKNARLTAQLMKKYSAFMVMVCNDAMQYVYSFNDPDAISWEDAPYSAYMGKSNADQMLSAFTQFNRMKL